MKERGVLSVQVPPHGFDEHGPAGAIVLVVGGAVVASVASVASELGCS